MNLIYMHSHDTGRHIQPFGHAIPTPHLQRLAEQGVLFRQAHCAGPTCSPSRAALLTGQFAHSCGMLGLAHRGFTINDYSHTLGRLLRERGYHTAIAGGQHVARVPFADPAVELGYDHWLNQDLDERGEARESGIVPAVERFFEDPPQGPFFLDVGFTETHRNGRGFGAGDGVLDDRTVRVPPGLPDTPHTRRDMADFIASAQTLDEKIGLVLRALEESGLAENTLVFYTTDHGIAFPGMKCNLTDDGIGVSLIASGPPT